MSDIGEVAQLAMRNRKRTYAASQQPTKYLYSADSELNEHELWEQSIRWNGYGCNLDRLSPNLHTGARVRLTDGEDTRVGTLSYSKSTIGLPTWYLHEEGTDHAVAYTHGNYRVGVEFLEP